MVIVTHGYGVLQALGTDKGYGRGAWVDYCGHVELSRTEKGGHEWRMEGHDEIDIYQ